MPAPMTCRERWLATVRFTEVDRPVRMESIGIDDNTVIRWKKEGFNPQGPFLNFQTEFSMDPYAPVLVGAHLHPGFFPEFENKLLEDDGRRKVVQTSAGAIEEIFTDGAMSIPRFLKFPVENSDDFQKILPRLNPADHGRIDNWKWAFDLAKATQYPLWIFVSGCFGLHRHLMGFENLMAAYVENPDLIHQMSAAWEKLVISCIERSCTHGKVDIVQFWEDMSYRNGPMISPRMFKEFIQPYYKRVCDRAAELGVPVLLVDTDGDCNLLLSLFTEAGINTMLPFEVQAGMDIRKVREKFPRLAILGGLDKHALAISKQAIDAELEAKMTFMLDRRGYIPAIDHVVPPDVPYENWLYFLQRVRGWK